MCLFFANYDSLHNGKLFCVIVQYAIGVELSMAKRKYNNHNKKREVKNAKHYKRLKVIQALLFIPILLIFAHLWVQSTFGSIGMEEIMFHLNMPLKGTPYKMFLEFFLKVIYLTALFGGTIAYALTLSKWIRKNIALFTAVSAVVLIIASVSLLYVANGIYGIAEYLHNRSEASVFIAEHYVDPNEVELTFPDKKRNLICIYVESAETSLQDKANGGGFDVNYIPEMTALAKQNISFSRNDALLGAHVGPYSHWTIAALVAETSGIPLKLASATHLGDKMGNYTAFLPGVTSLGDILASKGYNNFFMAGSDFDFAGRTDYFTQHGNYDIWDYYTAIETGKIPSNYYEWWGFEDKKLYEYAKEELLKLAADDKPFNFSLLTVDTHFEDGYVCENCVDLYDNQYANVWGCASKQLSEFVSWIQQQDFYKNTTIVILGDHLTMDMNFFDKLNVNRGVYNVFINGAITPLKEKNRQFCTMDFFPTTLAALGVKIEGNRLGLGTNLYSETDTLIEEVGYSYMDSELRKYSEFYNEELMFP